MATQADVDQVVSQLQDSEAGIAAVDQKLSDVSTTLQSELDSLQQQISDAGASIDLSALQAIPGELDAASSQLSAHVDAVGQLAPSQPGSVDTGTAPADTTPADTTPPDSSQVA